ncbi:hypothetical protein KGO95_02665 [Patescibacteria group bacterium]|nr:hypothetical protein [Patescibacteria group bacterium]
MERFLLDAAQLRKYLPALSESQKNAIRNGKKIKVAEEQREGWTGKLPFYIFWCPTCDNFSYDYPHGFIETQYLTCHKCSKRIDFRPWWVELAQLWELIKWMCRRDKKNAGGAK